MRSILVNSRSMALLTRSTIDPAGVSPDKAAAAATSVAVNLRTRPARFALTLERATASTALWSDASTTRLPGCSFRTFARGRVGGTAFATTGLDAGFFTIVFFSTAFPAAFFLAVLRTAFFAARFFGGVEDGFFGMKRSH